MAISRASLVFVLPEEDEGLALSREEVRELRKKLQRLEELEKEHAENEEQIRKLKEQLRQAREAYRNLRASFPFLAADARTAEAVGVPSSRTFWRRTHRDRTPRKRGGQPGHKPTARPKPTPNAPPITLSLERCTYCGERLGEPLDWRSRTLVDLPPPTPLIFDVRIPRYTCPGCHERVEPESPYPAYQRYGWGLLSAVVQLRLLGLSSGKIAEWMQWTHGIHLSPAVIVKMEAQTAASLSPLYDGLTEEIRQALVVNADETRFPVGGEDGWMWSFSSPTTSLYRIAPTRGQSVAHEVLGDYRGRLGHDAYDVYDTFPHAIHQLDHLHINRWLEVMEIKNRLEPRPLVREVDAKLTRAGHPPDEVLRFADGVRRILRGTILWADAHPEAPGRMGRKARRAAERALARLLREPWRDEDCSRIAGTLRKHRRSVSTFLTEPGVSWNNNAAETEIRQGVLYRKISGGRRSWAGAAVLERLLTAYRTCKKRSLQFLQVLKTSHQGSGYPGFAPSSGAPTS